MTVVGWTIVLALGLAIGEPGPGGLADYIVEIAASGAVGLVMIGIVAMLALLWLFPRVQAREARARVGWWTWPCAAGNLQPAPGGGFYFTWQSCMIDVLE
jgi:hypothetical protein